MDRLAQSRGQVLGTEGEVKQPLWSFTSIVFTQRRGVSPLRRFVVERATHWLSHVRHTMAGVTHGNVLLVRERYSIYVSVKVSWLHRGGGTGEVRWANWSRTVQCFCSKSLFVSSVCYSSINVSHLHPLPVRLSPLNKQNRSSCQLRPSPIHDPLNQSQPFLVAFQKCRFLTHCLHIHAQCSVGMWGRHRN